MHRAQVEQFVYNAPSPLWTVGTGIGAALLAGFIAVAGWEYVHRKTKARDLLNWRRTTVAESVTEMLLLSQTRFDTIKDFDDDRKEWTSQIRKLETQYQILNLSLPRTSAIREAANSLMDAHKLSFKTFTGDAKLPNARNRKQLDSISYMQNVDIDKLHRKVRNTTYEFLDI